MDAYFDDDEDDEEEAMELVGGGGGRDGSKGSRPYTGGRAGGGGLGRSSAVVTSSGVSAGGDTVKMRPNAAGGARREEYHLQVSVLRGDSQMMSAELLGFCPPPLLSVPIPPNLPSFLRLKFGYPPSLLTSFMNGSFWLRTVDATYRF